jgi:molybdenum cofactor biosynthesis enzyme
MSNARNPSPVFAFEELGTELPRPPLAAIRFFRRSGIKVGLRTWQSLPADVRWAMATEGARNVVDENIAKTLMRHVPLRELELVDDRSTPEVDPAPGLAESLGQGPDWVNVTWPSLPPFSRFVLNVLRNNKRLLWRAYQEIFGVRLLREEWRGSVAHAEVLVVVGGEVQRDLMRLLATERLLDGRALLLARASGRRAARAASELFDLYAEDAPAAIELDWSVQVPAGIIVWQAHVSSHTGSFFPAASLAAATIASVCLLDMIKEFDPTAVLREARIVEEAWQVGRLDAEATTGVFR